MMSSSPSAANAAFRLAIYRHHALMVKTESYAVLGGHMSGKLIKTTAIIALSILLLYSGVAWALQDCLLGEAIRHGVDEHTEAAIATTEGLDLILARFLHSSHQPREIVHCDEARHLIGPIGPPSSVFRMVRADESGSLELSFSRDSASSRAKKTVWLADLSSPRLSRHLLPILRI